MLIYYFIKFIIILFMQISIVQGHNKYQKTDHLYDPLRKAFLSAHDYNKLEQMKEACKVSHISHVVNNLSYGESLELAEHTLIPEDVKLRPTHHYWKIPKDHEYRIVNVEKRILQPITKQELQKKLNEQKQEQIIVYSIESSENKKQKDQTINYLKNNLNIKPGYQSQFLYQNSHTYQERMKKQPIEGLFKRSAVQTPFNHQFKTNYQQSRFIVAKNNIDLISKPILDIAEPKNSQNNEKSDKLVNPTCQIIRPNSSIHSNQVGSNQNVSYSYTTEPLRPDTITLPKNNQPFGFKYNSINQKKIQQYATNHDSYLPSMDTTFMIDRGSVTPFQSKPLSSSNAPILNHNATQSIDFRNTITPIKRSQIKSPQQNSFNNSTDKNSALRNTSALTKIKSFNLVSEEPIQQKSLNYKSPSPIAKTQAKIEQTVPQLSHRQLRQRRKSGIKLTNPNYNLFSTIDQPVNNILNGKICTCPHNQIIAQKVHQITWYSNMRGDQVE